MYPLLSMCHQGGKEESKDLGVNHLPTHSSAETNKHDCRSFPARDQPATLPLATEREGGGLVVRTTLWVLLLFKMFASQNKIAGQTPNPKFQYGSSGVEVWNLHPNAHLRDLTKELCSSQGLCEELVLLEEDQVSFQQC